MNPVPKKSPTGTSTDGDSSPSQYIRRSMRLRKYGSEEAIVIQIIVTTPGP